MGRNRQEDMTPDELVAAVRAEHDDRRKVRSERATKTKKLPDVLACWQRAFLAQHLPGEVRYSTPTGKDVGIFLRHYSRYGAKRNMQELLMRICDRWDDLRLGPLSWHDGVPRKPSFHFLAHHLRFFVDALDKLDNKAQPENRSVDGPAQPITHGKRKRRSWRDLNRVD